MALKIKRAYEAPSPDDGTRVLVDRLWPRGVGRDRLDALWMKELAPSAELRRWYGHELDRFPEFVARYHRELLLGDGEALLRLVRMASAGRVTLIYGARDTRHNQARVLSDFLNEMASPPSKAELRRRMKAWRGGLPVDVARHQSEQVRTALVDLQAWKRAQGVLLYLSVGREVDTLPLLHQALAAGKRVFAPQVERAGRRLKVGEIRRPEDDLVPGPFQAIPEPRQAGPVADVAAAIDLVLVPGLAFDRFGNRVGYGAGYYDRLLSELPPQTPRIALLYSGQLVPRCPAGPSDQPVTALACEAGVLGLWEDPR